MKAKAITIAFAALVLFTAVGGVAFARQVQLLQKHLATNSTLQDYWPMENTSQKIGTSTLTNEGSTTFNAGLFFNAADFGSSNTTRYLQVGNHVGLTINSPFTINMWVDVINQPANNTPAMLFLWQNSSSGSGNEGFFNGQIYNNAGTMQMYVGRQRATILDQYGANKTLTPGTWYMVTFEYDRTSLYLYVNNTLVASGNSTPTSTGTLAGFDGLTIGQDPDNAGRFTSAQIDDVSVFSSALSSASRADLLTSRSLQGNDISR